jgi:hypothetical protein
MGIGILFLVRKAVGLAVNHSPVPSTAVKNEWSYTSAPHMCLHDILFTYEVVIPKCINFTI